jgi:4-amino-4-deoxy-L-arabinose transferase-like glycosyltransferase
VWIALTAATAIAALLRLPFLSHQSLWLDEIYTRSVLREPSLAGLWQHLEATESTPPLYYLVGWLLHAHSAAAMRLIPALSLIAAVPVSYLAFRRLIGSPAALASAAILTVNPMLVAYSTDARSYGLFTLTALLSVWGFSALLQERSPRRFALWASASVACIWSHYFGVFLVAGEVVLLLLALPQDRLATACWSGLLGLCLIPLGPLVASQTGNERAGFIAGMPLGQRLLEAVRQLSMGANVPRTWLEAAGLAVFCLAVLVGVWLALRARERSRLLLALAATAFLAPLLLSALKIEDRFYARNMIATLPLAAALAAPAMLRLKAAPLAIYLTLATLTSVWVATNWRYQQVDWRGALARAESLDRRAPVLAVNDLGTPVIETYLARRPAAGQMLAKRVWLIVEPIRAAGHRFLGPAPAPAVPGFTAVHTLRPHGFQLVLLGAPNPTPIAAAEVPGTTLFPGG